MMKKITFLFALLTVSFGFSQALPFDFGTTAAPTLHSFMADGTGNSVANAVDPDDGSNSVLSITGSGEQWDNAQVTFAAPIDLSDNENNAISFRIKATSGDGIGGHGLKFEGGAGGPVETEVLFTTEDNDWKTVVLDFPAGLGTFTKMVMFVDRGNTDGNGNVYLVDDIQQVAAPCVSAELPMDFSDPNDALFTTGDGASAQIVSEQLEITGVANNWDNVKYTFCNPIDLSDDANNTLTFRMRSTTAGNGEVRTHGVSFQPVSGASEINFTTTGQDWTDVELDFGAGLATYLDMVIFTDSGTFGDGGSSNLATGTYLIDDVVLGPTLSTRELKELSFSVFPNPTQDRWTVKAQNTDIKSIRLYDVLGKNVLSLSPNRSEAVIEGYDLNKGLYFAKIETDSGTSSLKLIKQ